MSEQQNIIQIKQVVATGFVQYTQEIVDLAKQGYVLDVSIKHCPQWQLGLFMATMLLLEDAPSEPVVDETVEAKPKRTYAKSEQKKEGLRSKLPTEALQTITK